MLKHLLFAISVATFTNGLWGQTLTFTPAAGSPYDTGGSAPRALVVGDFNRDGAPDVMVANSGQAYANSSSANYTAWLGQFAGGLPNGTLGTGHAIPFFSDATSDRALNIALQKALGYYPGIAGGSKMNRLRFGIPWPSGASAFATSIAYMSYGGFPGLSSSTLSNWGATGDLNGDGIDDIAVSHIDSSTLLPIGTIAVFTGTTSGGNVSGFQNSDVSSNEIVALFGTNLACAVTPRVLVDGVGAQVLGATDKQVNWLAPDVTGRTSISVQVACGSNVSEPFTVKVAPVVPGIFTSNGKQAAAYNAGFTLNGPAIPIARGRVIMLFGTGFGAFNAADANGLLTQSVPVTVTVGGIAATVTFAGAAPGLPGVNQINVLIPDAAPTGPAVPLVVTAGGAQVPAGITLAIGTATNDSGITGN